mgnify:CR=1 FL=1
MSDLYEFPKETGMKRDAMTLDMFEVPQPLPALEGTHDFRQVVAGLVGELLEQAVAGGMTRHQVAAEVSRLTGKEVKGGQELIRPELHVRQSTGKPVER